MDPHLREALGTISRWALLAMAACAAVGLGLWVLLALPATHAASQGWAVVPDAVVTTGGRTMPIARCEPIPTIQHADLFFTYRTDQPEVLRASWSDVRNSQVFLHAGLHDKPGATRLLAVTNPYAGLRPSVAEATLRAWSRPTSVLIIDIDSVSGLVSHGRLISSAEQAAPELLARLPLTRLANHQPLICLTGVQLSDYDQVRRLMAMAVEAPLLPTSTRRDQPGTVEQAIGLVRRLSFQLGAPVTLVTADPALAERCARDGSAIQPVHP